MVVDEDLNMPIFRERRPNAPDTPWSILLKGYDEGAFATNETIPVIISVPVDISVCVRIIPTATVIGGHAAAFLVGQGWLSQPFEAGEAPNQVGISVLHSFTSSGEVVLVALK
jgi:hypothetical protein